MLRRSMVALALALAAACGPSRSPGSPPGDGGGTGGGGTGGGQPTGGGASGQPSGGGGDGNPSAGGPGAPTSGGGGDGQPSGGDAGSGSSGGASAGGTSGAGGPGNAGPGAGTVAPAGPVVSRDGTVEIARLDPDPECDGLVPSSAPDAVAATFAGPASLCGIAGPSDGAGNVPAQTDTRLGTDSAFRDWTAFTAGGRPASTFSLTTSFFVGEELLAQPDGWVGVFAGGRQGSYSSVEVRFLSGDGTLRRSERIDGVGLTHEWAIAGDPLGGALVTHSWHGVGACTGDARRYDATGATRGAPGAIGCFTSGVGVSSLGEALVLEQAAGGGIVHWIDVDGSPARPPEADPAAPGLPGGGHLRLAPLLDGSLVAGDGSGWTLRYPHLATQSEPAPGWLASLGRTRFRNTRGNRGYAFFADAPRDSPDCSQIVELRAASGRRCGTVTLRNPGGPCAPGPADQGWDGTVAERNARAPCAWRLWPKLLGD